MPGMLPRDAEPHTPSSLSIFSAVVGLAASSSGENQVDQNKEHGAIIPLVR